MTPISSPIAPDAPASRRVPPLRNGDRLTRAEFERRYQAMPDVKKAELIEGVVYMPSLVSLEHAAAHFKIITWLGVYTMATPGVEGETDGTLRLDMDNAPQPDAFLRILETHGGQARVDKEGYVTGARTGRRGGRQQRQLRPARQAQRLSPQRRPRVCRLARRGWCPRLVRLRGRAL